MSPVARFVTALAWGAGALAACVADQDLGDAPGPWECDERPCAREQVCHQGTCIARSQGGEPCDAERARRGEDTCPPDAVCRAGEGTGTCRPLTPCGRDYACELGPVGATCNRTDLGGKARVCLEGQCATASECPEGSRCVPSLGAIGVCSNGAAGSFCTAAADCRSGNCGGFGGVGICF